MKEQGKIFQSFIGVYFILILTGCHTSGPESKELHETVKNNPGGIINCCKDTSKKPLTCNLTSAQLQKRRATVLTVLKQKVLEKKEIENGFAFKFNGSDSTINQLADFIESERQCCDFFSFNLKIADAKSFVWLEISGPKGAKEFIADELEL